MSVSFTTNVGLAKPTGSELAEEWVNGAKLQEDNNIIIAAQTNKILSFYTPTIIGATSNPNIGASGSSFGEYQDINGFIIGRFIITFSGAGISVGSGEYGISLPFPVNEVFYYVGTALNDVPGFPNVVGEGYHYDDSSVATSGSAALDIVTISSVSYVRFITEAHTSPAKTSRIFRDSMPYAVAANDTLAGDFCYLKA